MFSIIVACCRSGAIGFRGSLLHKIKEDLQFLKNTTLGHRVIIGRKTYETIPNRLVGREVVVISSNNNYHCTKRDDIIVVESFDEAVEISKCDDEVFILGGGRVYREAMLVADKIYLTMINDFCIGDVYLENFDNDDWRVVEKNFFIDADSLHYERLILVRKN